MSGEASSEIKKLSEAQTKAYDEIKTAFTDNEVVLLHGVTSSGKTEIYVRLIEEMISAGLSAPLHEGALKYYKERGWIK